MVAAIKLESVAAFVGIRTIAPIALRDMISTPKRYVTNP
jgi:hypothetical protein